MRWSVLAMTFALSAGAFAQTAPAVLTGMVVDAATQSPLGDATVIARSPALPGEQTVVTDSSGAFEMTLLPAATYSLAVQRDGFQTYSPEGLVLKGGRMRVRIAVLPVATPATLAAAAVEFNDTMTAPAMISGPAPEYTADALDREVEGNMQVRCIVTAEGQVRACKVVKGLPFMRSE